MSKPRIKPGTAVEVEWDASKCECCGKQRNAWRVSQDGELVGHYGYVTIDNTTRHTLDPKTGKPTGAAPGNRKHVRAVLRGTLVHLRDNWNMGSTSEWTDVSLSRTRGFQTEANRGWITGPRARLRGLFGDALISVSRNVHYRDIHRAKSTKTDRQRTTT